MAVSHGFLLCGIHSLRKVNEMSLVKPEFPKFFGNKKGAWVCSVAVRSVTAVCSITYKNRNHAIQQLVLLFIDAKK